MGQDFFSFFRLESKRLLWFIGITFAIILAFQYLELPYGNVLLSLFSSGNIPISGISVIQGSDPPSISEIANNVTIVNKENSTTEHAPDTQTANKTRMPEENDTIPRRGFDLEPGSQPNTSLGFDESNKSSMEDRTKNSGNVPATKQAEDLGPSNSKSTTGLNTSTNSTREENITSRPEHKSGSSDANSTSSSTEKEATYLTPPFSPTTNVSPDISTAVSANYSSISLFQKENKTNSMKGGSFGPPQNDGSSIVGKNSAINSKPKENQDSHTSASAVTSICKMNKLLL